MSIEDELAWLRYTVQRARAWAIRLTTEGAV
ncbi:hypothetical protein RCH14_000411 [Massilia sp. MP_M2]|jgi:hypothetical protein